MSFQNCHSLLVSSIHAFIQQTFTGYPLYARHCARRAGRIRILASSRISVHTALDVAVTLAFLQVFVRGPFILWHKSQLKCSSSRRSCLICTLTRPWIRLSLPIIYSHSISFALNSTLSSPMDSQLHVGRDCLSRD